MSIGSRARSASATSITPKALDAAAAYSDRPGSQRYPPLFRYFCPDRGNFIAFVSNFRLRGMLKETVTAFQAGSDFPVEHVGTFSFVPGVSWSDHQSFWRQGYPALMVTDTAFYRYAYYHTAQDTPEKVDYAAVVQGLYKAIASLAMEKYGQFTAHPAACDVPRPHRRRPRRRWLPDGTAAPLAKAALQPTFRRMNAVRNLVHGFLFFLPFRMRLRKRRYRSTLSQV